MQQVFPLHGRIGGALRITTATNCTPQGTFLQDHGVVPDYEVKQECANLFVNSGPQNIYQSGWEFEKELIKEHLVAKYGERPIAKTIEAGDLQLQTAVSLLEEAIDK